MTSASITEIANSEKTQHGRFGEAGGAAQLRWGKDRKPSAALGFPLRRNQGSSQSGFLAYSFKERPLRREMCDTGSGVF